MVRFRTRQSALVVGAALLLLVGVGALAGSAQSATPAAGAPCASPQASPAASGTPAATASPAAGCGPTVTMLDIAFKPTEFTIAANTNVTVTLKNTGATKHNFSITDHNNSGVKNLNISVDAQPGETKTVTVNAPAGDYYYFCNVPGHEAAGMHGVMHVK